MTTVEAHIVTYNSRTEIGDCLSSLLRHAPNDPSINFSIAVLDNGSDDGTADYVAERFPHLRLIRWTPNVFYGPAANELVASATAELLFVINPDTVVEADPVTPLVQALRAHPKVAIACPVVVGFDGSKQSFIQQFPSVAYELALLLRGTKFGRLFGGRWDSDTLVGRTRDELPPADVEFPIRFIWATAWMIRTEIARQYPISPHFPMYDSDLDVCRRMADDHRLAMLVTSAAVRHIGGTSTSPECKRRMELTARARYYRRYHGRLSSLAYKVLVTALPRAMRLKRWLA